MTTRAVLPNRRVSQTIRFAHGGHRYYATLGYSTPEDRLANNAIEVFLDTGKPGTDVQHMARDGAVVLSLALQHGVPVGVLRQAITRLDDGAPAGAFGKLLDIMGGP